MTRRAPSIVVWHVLGKKRPVAGPRSWSRIGTLVLSSSGQTRLSPKREKRVQRRSGSLLMIRVQPESAAASAASTKRATQAAARPGRRRGIGVGMTWLPPSVVRQEAPRVAPGSARSKISTHQVPADPGRDLEVEVVPVRAVVARGQDRREHVLV